MTGKLDASGILGRGAFGAVHRGTSNGRAVAVKILDSESRAGGQGITEFQREVHVLSQCRDDHIVPLLAFCLEPGKPLCLVYQLMAGGALSDALRTPERRAALDAVARLRIATDVACGLRYLHAISGSKPTIVHRDFKSGNILLDGTGRARLGDAGLAREPGAAGMTLTAGFALGTPGYLDP